MFIKYEIRKDNSQYNHLWAVKAPDEEVDELTLLFRKWNNAEYLLDFFMENFED